MKFLKALSPYLLGFLLVISFPLGGTEMISFFYGEIGRGSSLQETSNAYVYDAFEILLVIYLLSVLIVSILYFRKRSIKISLKKQILACLILPVLGYTYVLTQIRNENNLSVGLYLAVFRSDLVHLERLLAIGANPNTVALENNPREYTPLMIAFGNNNVETAKKLLASGAKIDATNKDGKTAEDIAKDRESADVLKLLSQK